MQKTTTYCRAILACLAIIAAGCLPMSLIAQVAADTTVYQTVEEAPLFPGCEKLDTTMEAKRNCSSQQLLALIYQNVRYPQEAIEKNIEGTVVLTFIIEKDGLISSPRILKDIGGGCGFEALRVVSQMNEAGIRWTPGRNKGQDVRSNFNLPVRFKIKEAPPFSISAYGDTVYTRFDQALKFKGGDEALAEFLNKRLKYPETYKDSCQVGNIDVQILVRPNGDVRILDITDYNSLGFDFWYEAIDASTATLGQWEPAVYQNRKVPSGFEISLSFSPIAAGCKAIADKYDLATRLINEGSALYGEGKQEEGLAKMSESIALFPDHAGLLLVRGQAYLDMNKLPEACADLSKARSIALVDWYDSILPLICR